MSPYELLTTAQFAIKECRATGYPELANVALVLPRHCTGVRCRVLPGMMGEIMNMTTRDDGTKQTVIRVSAYDIVRYFEKQDRP